MFEQITAEIWENINGYEGLYQVSNLGSVKSLGRKTPDGRKIKEKKLKPSDRGGYMVVALYKNNKAKMFTVHRLAAKAFIPNPENKPQVNHIDGNKSNNKICNLEWVTNQENAKHAWDNGLIKMTNATKKQISNTKTGVRLSNTHKQKISKGMKNKNKGSENPHAKNIICLNTGEIFGCITDASKKYNIHVASISDCCRHKRKSGGRINNAKAIWMFYEEYNKR